MPVSDKHSDEELARLLKQGSDAAFTEIYNRYWQTLYAMAYNRLRDIQAAEDIVHDVFTSLWNNRETAVIGTLPGYMATATKYLILAYIRKTAGRTAYGAALEGMALPVSAGLEEMLDHRRLLELLQEEVEKLPERCKLVFKYSREQHKTVKEIAGELDISASTVENQLNKALGKLRIVSKNFNSLLFSILF